MKNVKKARVDLRPKEESIKFEVDGKKQSGSYSWFRGENTNYNPRKENMKDEFSVTRNLLSGWLPDKPFIYQNTKVTAFGSCFAANISKWLSERNFNVLTDKGSNDNEAYIIRFGEGMVNTFVIRQQFEWAFEGKTFGKELWHGQNTESFGYNESVRQKTLDIFKETDVFILTLGLSEIWYDAETGGVLWRAVPRDKYDPSRHKFRVSTVEENKNNIKEIYKLIRKYRPDAKIIFTVSPIPLVATFRPVSCITANAVSKAILRSALDEFLRDLDDGSSVYYWPSYEIVMDIYSDRWKEDRRHVKEQILEYIMTLFEHYWCSESTPKYSVLEAWLRSLCGTGSLGIGVLKAIDNHDKEELNLIIDKLRSRKGKEFELEMLERFIKEI